MMNQHENFPDLMQEETFEVVMRGYNRRQVHDYMMRTRNQIRDLEERLARAIEQAEQGRIELAEARRRMVETPQSYEDLSPRLAQILRLGEEEAQAKREDAEAEAARVREEAQAEADRLVTSARETSDKILTSAQAEAERRVSEATQAAERMLAQAGSDAEEQLTAARTESEETLANARAEAERLVTTAREESEQLLASAQAQAEQIVSGARAEADALLTGAQQRAAAIDEQAGRRVDYLTNTHTEVVRRLTEISTVLGDLMVAESNAGPLVPESALPTSPALPRPQASQDDVRVIIEDGESSAEPARTSDASSEAASDVASNAASDVAPDAASNAVSDPVPAPDPAGTEISDDTDVHIVRLPETPAHK